jgi:integrase
MKRSTKNPPHVHEYENQHSKTVYYLRRPGYKKVRLRIPDDALPWSPRFMAIYDAALAEMPAAPTIGASKTVAGTVNAAMIGYFQSPAFGVGVAESTKKVRRAILESFRAEHGDKRVAMMHTTALQIITNKKKPVAQRNFKKAMRGFINYCIGQNLISSNPFADVELEKIKKTGGHHTWTEDEIAQYAARHPTGTKARLALALLLQTGHARADVARMGRQHVKHGKLSMRRKKTDVAFDIPVLPDLAAELALHPSAGQLAFLVTDYGQPFTAKGFGNKFRDWCNQANLLHCSAHGLRKAAAVRHALNGATAPELMAWFGWKSIGEAQRYIEEANRIKLAENAGAKIISATAIGSHSDPVSQNDQKPQQGQ